MFYFFKGFSYCALAVILQLEWCRNLKNVNEVAEIAPYKAFIIHFIAMISDQTFLRRSFCKWLLFLFWLIILFRNETFNASCLYTNHNHYRKTVKSAKDKVYTGRLFSGLVLWGRVYMSFYREGWGLNF